MYINDSTRPQKANISHLCSLTVPSCKCSAHGKALTSPPGDYTSSWEQLGWWALSSELPAWVSHMCSRKLGAGHLHQVVSYWLAEREEKDESRALLAYLFRCSGLAPADTLSKGMNACTHRLREYMPL